MEEDSWEFSDLVTSHSSMLRDFVTGLLHFIQFFFSIWRLLTADGIQIMKI